MKRKRNLTPVWSVIGLILTIAVAVYLPQFVFMVQDYHQTSSVDVISRDTVEILATETSYSADINTRMSKLVSTGYGDITVSRVASSIDINDFNALITNVKNQSYMLHLTALLPDSFGEAVNTLNATQMKACDRYIVYGNDYTDGVILMFWYMRFDLTEQNSYLELIVDSETNTIYYVRLREDTNATDKSDVEEVNFAVNGSDLYYDKLRYNMNTLPEMSPEVETLVEQFPILFNDYYCSYYGIYMPDVSLLNESSAWWDHVSVGENVFTMAYALPYISSGNKSVFFRFHAEVGPETNTDISIGIPIIRQMVQS